MTNHPNRGRSKLAEYGGRLRTIDGRKVVEMVDPNDNGRARYQYRRAGERLERRVLQHNGQPFRNGSPWEPYRDSDLAEMRAARGKYHPILDPLGL